MNLAVSSWAERPQRFSDPLLLRGGRRPRRSGWHPNKLCAVTNNAASAPRSSCPNPSLKVRATRANRTHLLRNCS